MKNFTLKLMNFFIHLWTKLQFLFKYFKGSLFSFFQILLFRVNPFWIQLTYFLTLSLLGFTGLKLLNPRTTTTTANPFDIFFTCISSATVSSVSTVEMEYFSNTQLVILAILMFCGGEVFTSIIGLHLRRLKLKQRVKIDIKDDSRVLDSQGDHVEIVVQMGFEKDSKSMMEKKNYNIKSNSMRILAILVTCYLLLVNVVGSTLISIYFIIIPNAQQVIKQKGLNLQMFSIITAVSTFTNCGFLPTNESMMVFKKNSGLLLILIPLILSGNIMFAVFLRLVIWVLEKTTDKDEFKYLMEKSRKLGYGHLFPGKHSLLLGFTGLGFIIVQMVLFCALEWNDEATASLSGYEKFVACLFQVVNVRHAGESVFDLATVSPAIMVIFLIMMYLPSYTVCLPIKEAENYAIKKFTRGGGKSKKERVNIWDQILFSELSYLIIFIIAVCIIERENIKMDPLNFNIFNIVVEIISAYGNVGFSMGYSCEKRINQEGFCKNAWYGFGGRWSNEGKFVLIVSMFYGRCKRLNLNGGRAWIVL